MKTINKGQTATLRFSLNSEKASEAPATLTLNSPSRTSVTYTKSLASIGSGFFTIDLTFTDTNLLEDDTYSYTLEQSGVYLKTGFIRLIDTAQENATFDYELDFLMM